MYGQRRLVILDQPRGMTTSINHPFPCPAYPIQSILMRLRNHVRLCFLVWNTLFRRTALSWQLSFIQLVQAWKSLWLSKHWFLCLHAPVVVTIYDLGSALLSLSFRHLLLFMIFPFFHMNGAGDLWIDISLDIRDHLHMVVFWLLESISFFLINHCWGM